MNPLLQAALGSIIRYGLALGAGYLVKAGIWTGSDAETYIAVGTMGMLSLGWSLWAQYKDRIVLLTALTMPRGMTENDVKQHISSGGLTPPISTPKDEVPTMTPPKAIEPEPPVVLPPAA
jgi:hypothetical protein